MDERLLAIGFLQYVIFLFSTVCHEAAHAWAAQVGGDETAARAGQVSLDPLPHLQREPFGMVLVPLMTFASSGSMVGWASAPFDPDWAERYPRRAALMALAGPLANLVLAVLAAWLQVAGRRHGWVAADLAAALGLACSLNLLLFVFNMLPVPPMDGSAAVGLLLPEATARAWNAWMRQPLVSMAGLVLAWSAFPRFAGPILHTLQTWLRGAL